MGKFESEHGPLLAVAESLIEQLSQLSGRIDALGDVWQHQHTVFADRCSALGEYLSASVALATSELYAPAFCVLRGALEHHVFDLLLMLADRYEQTFIGVTRQGFADFEASLLDAANIDILSHSYKGGTLKIVRRGVRFEDSDEILSMYYGLLEQVDPFIGTKSEQAELDPHFSDLSLREQFAQRNEDTRAGRLGWAHLIRNLILNELLTQRDAVRLQVHYRFLGAYVHPTSSRAPEILHGRYPFDSKGYDHYSSELVLLYVVAFASRELRAFRDMSERAPRLNIREWEDTERILADADEKASHLWFPPNEPPWFDRIKEANNRGLVEGEFVPRDGRQPEQIPSAEVRYYDNPLGRLISMHHHQNEMTGFPYTSPWPRDDRRL